MFERSGSEIFADVEPRAARDILEAAVDEFHENGYKAGSIAQIASRAQVSKSLVMYHFRTKDEVGESIVKVTSPDGLFLGGARYSADPLDALSKAVQHAAHLVASERAARVALKIQWFDGIRVGNARANYSGWISRITGYLEEAMVNGLVVSTIDIGRESRVIVGCAAGLIRLVVTMHMYESLVEDCLQLVRAQLDRLRPQS